MWREMSCFDWPLVVFSLADLVGSLVTRKSDDA